MRLIKILATSLLLCACMVSDTNTPSIVLEDTPTGMAAWADVDSAPWIFADVPMEAVKSTAFSYDGSALVINIPAGTLLFDMNTGEIRPIMEGGTLRMALNHTRDFLAVEHHDYVVIHDLSTAKTIAALPIERTYMTKANADSSSNTPLPSVGFRITSSNTARERLLPPVPIVWNQIKVLEWSSTNHLTVQDNLDIYFALSGESVFKVWVKDRGLIPKTVAETLQSDDKPKVRAWQWSPNGQLLAVSLSDGSLQILDSGKNSVDTWQNVAGGVLTFSPSGSHIAVSGSPLLTLPERIRISAEKRLGGYLNEHAPQ